MSKRKRGSAQVYPARRTGRGAYGKGYRKYRRYGGKGFTRNVGYYGRYNANPGRELKFFDGTRAIASATEAGVIYDDSLNHIVQGVAEQQRIGRKVTITKLSMRGLVKLPAQANGDDAFNRIRIIIYQDKQTNGATAAVTDLLDTADIDSFRNLENSGRFNFFYDKTITFMPPNAYFDSVAAQRRVNEIGKNWRFNKDCNIPVIFNSTTGAITEMPTNNIGIMAICGTFATVAPQFQYKWRVRFTG